MFMAPARISLKKGDEVILPVSSSLALVITFSHTRRGRNAKKKNQLTVKNRKEMEGEKQVEVQCNTRRMGGNVCVCFLSMCAHAH